MKLNRHLSSIRQSIAVEAARCIAEQGGGDLRWARDKAARRLGIKDRRSKSLPELSEIEEELTRHQNLFQIDTHPALLQHQREISIHAMKLFSAFNPRLVGAVLAGNSGEHTPITIYTDTEYPEAIAHILMDSNIPYTITEHTISYGTKTERAPCYKFNADNQAIEVVALSWNMRHNKTTDPVNGGTEASATPAQLIKILGTSNSVSV